MLVAGLAAHGSYLEFKLRTAEVRPLLLPEVVRLDDESDVDAAGEGLLQDLQQRLDGVPLGPAHVHDHREASLADLFAREKGNTLKPATRATVSGQHPLGDAAAASFVLSPDVGLRGQGCPLHPQPGCGSALRGACGEA